MRVMFFCKSSKYYLHFKNAKKNSEKAFCFLDNCIWIGCVNLPLLRTKILWPAVNMFKNSPNICILLGHTFSNSIAFTLINKYAKAPVFQIWTVFETVCHVAFWRSSERDFLDIYLTAVFQVRTLENTSAMKVIFFMKIFKIFSTFPKCLKGVEKMFSLLEIITSQLATSNCVY